ncbi:MAG: hypothetical protein DCF15_10320 [Phormidesmis priestleyi]|uniref:Uncharacterized protein n=1 Tax=Phormidesmis priestleyi TaxID=268141 RepID=A0A2W4XHN5_9CYAN|nr:MAG: hypothetical protein DCF15_10320 [Phormidesmis priestleyi]
MESVRVRQRIGQDGILHLEIPVGFTDREVEAMVVYQPVQASTVEVLSLDQLYGRCSDDLIVLDNQGVSEALDDELAEAFE